MQMTYDAKTFLKHFGDCLFYFCSTCADSITYKDESGLFYHITRHVVLDSKVDSGINLYGSRVNDLRFADDIDIIALLFSN